MRLHLDLVDAREVVLDGIFGGDDFAVWAVQLAQGTVQSRSLSGAGGTCHQKDAIGPADDVLERAVVVFAESEVPDTDFNVVAVENAHDDRLPLPGRHQAHAPVAIVPPPPPLAPTRLRLPSP